MSTTMLVRAKNTMVIRVLGGDRLWTLSGALYLIAEYARVLQ